MNSISTTKMTVFHNWDVSFKKNGTCTFMVRKHFSPTVTNQILHCLKIYFKILIFIHGCFITLIFQRYVRYEELRPLLFKNCKIFVLNCFFLQSYFFSFYVTEEIEGHTYSFPLIFREAPKLFIWAGT